MNCNIKGSDVKQKEGNNMGSRLTPKQKKIIKELDEIYRVIGMDYWSIERYPKESWSYTLEGQKRQAVVGEIVMQYTMIDEMMNMVTCMHFFGSSRSSIKLWKTKKFQDFNYYILECLYLVEKLRLVETFYEMPEKIVNDIYRLNDIRNAVAHTFFPENLRRYKKQNKVVYKGKEIFKLEGISLFAEDMKRVTDFFISKLP